MVVALVLTIGQMLSAAAPRLLTHEHDNGHGSHAHVLDQHHPEDQQDGDHTHALSSTEDVPSQISTPLVPTDWPTGLSGQHPPETHPDPIGHVFDCRHRPPFFASAPPGQAGGRAPPKRS